jgi:hypothetical protein
MSTHCITTWHETCALSLTKNIPRKRKGLVSGLLPTYATGRETANSNTDPVAPSVSQSCTTAETRRWTDKPSCTKARPTHILPRMNDSCPVITAAITAQGVIGLSMPYTRLLYDAPAFACRQLCRLTSQIKCSEQWNCWSRPHLLYTVHA